MAIPVWALVTGGWLAWEFYLKHRDFWKKSKGRKIARELVDIGWNVATLPVSAIHAIQIGMQLWKGWKTATGAAKLLKLSSVLGDAFQFGWQAADFKAEIDDISEVKKGDPEKLSILSKRAEELYSAQREFIKQMIELDDMEKIILMEMERRKKMRMGR